MKSLSLTKGLIKVSIKRQRSDTERELADLYPLRNGLK